MDDASETDAKLLADERFQRVLNDALAMQERFSAEPVYAKTGKGSLKSAGVEQLRKIKELARKLDESTSTES